MTGELDTQLRALVSQVAPDVDPASIRADVEFRDQFDFDSMDLFNFAVAIHAALGVNVPERDYRELTSLASAMAYLLRTRADQSAASSESTSRSAASQSSIS